MGLPNIAGVYLCNDMLYCEIYLGRRIVHKAALSFSRKVGKELKVRSLRTMMCTSGLLPQHESHAV